MPGMWVSRIRAEYRKYHPTVWVLVAGRLVTTAVLFMALPFLTIYLRSRGIALATVGLVLAAGPLGSAIGNLIGGQLADRLGRRPLIIVGLAAGGAATAALAFAEQPWLFAVLYGLQGLFGSLSGPAWSAALTDIVPEAHRREAFSLDRVATNIGTAIGPLAGALVSHRAILFLATGLTNIAFAALCAVLVAESLPSAVTQGEAAGGPNRSRAAISHDLAGWRAIAADRVMLLHMLARVISLLAYTQIFTTYSLYVGQFSHQPERLYSWVISLNGALVVATQMLLTRRTERWTMGRQMVAGCVLYAFSYLVFALPGPDTVALLACIIFTVGEMVISPSQLSFVARLAPEQARGRYMGAAFLAGTVGSMFAGTAGAWLLGRYGGAGLMLAMAVLTAGAAVLFGWSANLAERRDLGLEGLAAPAGSRV